MRQVRIHGPHGVIFETRIEGGYTMHEPEDFGHSFMIKDDAGELIVAGILTTANLIITPVDENFQGDQWQTAPKTPESSNEPTKISEISSPE